MAKHAGHIVAVHTTGPIVNDPEGMRKALQEYSKFIDPWAKRQALKMLTQVEKANKRAYAKKAKEIGKYIKTEVAEAPIGQTAFRLMNEQVELIKSIPLKAGERAQKLAFEAAINGDRAAAIAEELQKTTKVSESSAMLIARTEVARASAFINQSRAEAVGSSQYKWRNSGDAAVRDAHKTYHGHKLDGMVFSWNAPPTLDDGTTGHPGTFPNCRCYAEPVFDE